MARTSVTTGVVEVSEGDYFELAIRVVQDASVSLQPVGTFFSCHASSTEIGGSSPDTNDYVTSLAFGLSGQDVTLTLDRTGTLPSISGTFTLPTGSGTDTNDYVDSFVAGIVGSDLTMTLGRTGALGDLTQTVVLPAAGGGGNATTDRQRIEAIAFTAVAATTSQLRQQTLGATPSSVVYGTGAARDSDGYRGPRPHSPSWTLAST